MARSYEDELASLRKDGLLRQLRHFEPSDDLLLKLDGREIINFASNDYLGLANSRIVCDAAVNAVETFGVGSGASRLICGTRAPHVKLEQALARFKSAEAALTFSSGYAAAVGTLGALCRKGDVIILDKLCHASLIDGANLSGAKIRVFPHLHLAKLESHLKWARAHYPEGRVVVATESIFSMDGDRSPISEIVALKNRYSALLLLDEAHAIGVAGKNGRGLAFESGAEGLIDIHMGTLSKALGSSGGYICGSASLIDLLINRARSFIYSTAPSPVLAAAALSALNFLDSEAGEAQRQKLWQNVYHLQKELPPNLRLNSEPGSAIVPIILGDTHRALEASKKLLERGFFVPAIRFPTVARDGARLRITLSSSHTSAHISALCEALEEC